MNTFRISDLLRCILLNAPRGMNLACPRDGLSGASHPVKVVLWRDTLAQRRDRVTLARWDGLRLAGLASARARAGRLVWEVDHLFLPNGSPRSQDPHGRRTEPWPPCCLELLGGLTEEAGRHQAQRVFLRLPSNSPILPVAGRAGFFPCYEERLLEGWGGGHQAGVPAAPAGLREALPEDDYGLFQLFCASAPPSVRCAVGLTFDQWRDAYEPHRRGRSEWVVKTNGGVSGWLGLSRRSGVAGAELLAHPGKPQLWEALVERALAQEGRHRWLVPAYQELVPQLLLRRDFREAARYTILSRTVAVPVMKRGMAPVEA